MEPTNRAIAHPSDWWRPARSLATWLTVALGTQAVVMFATPLVDDQAPVYVRWHRAFDALLDGREREASRLFNQSGGRSTAFSVLGLVSIAALVLTIVWMWTCAHNARALGRTGARLSPGWAIGAWFVPVANLVLPYLLWSDLWRSADPASERGDAWRALPGAALVRLYWLVYVVGFCAAFTAPALAVTGVADESTTRALLVAAGALNAAASVLAILVVREITARQEAAQARDPAPAEPRAIRGTVGPTSIDAAGWYPDPGGVFDHRYWDGTGWTEHVSRQGVTATAPVAPPGWYPDPTGRFAWRYWTGNTWTEHVSRDGVLFVDRFGGDDDDAASPATGAP